MWQDTSLQWFWMPMNHQFLLLFSTPQHPKTSYFIQDLTIIEGNEEYQERDVLLGIFREFALDLNRGRYLTQLGSNQDYSVIHCQVMDDMQTLKVDQGNGFLAAGFYGKIGIRQLVCQQDQKRETRTWWAAAYVFAYDMWVHLKVRHLDIYCRRVVSVVSVTFLAKPFPPLHQLPFDCNKHLNFALLMLNTSHITKFLKPHVPKAVSSNSPWLVFPKSTALSKRMSAWWAWPLQQRQMSKLWFDVMSEVLHVK